LGFANTSICPKLKPKVALSSSTREQCQRKQICPLALLLGSAPTLPSSAGIARITPKELMDKLTAGELFQSWTCASPWISRRFLK
jgi:hypothetical protein